MKCGYDRHSGRATHPGVTAQAPDELPFQYDLYSHGQKIVLEVIETLRGHGAGQAGLTYTSYVENAGTVVAQQMVLPSIADAEQVLLMGHSASAHGLYQNADHYAEVLRAMPGFSGDIRAVHDAHFMHATENEAAFDPAQNPGPLTHNTLFDQRYAGTTGAIGSYDAQPYYVGPSAFSEIYRAWLETPLSTLGTILDASCVATHQGSGDTWKCLGRFHVRLHHETTTALVREDLSDPNVEHTDNLNGYLLRWGPYSAYPTAVTSDTHRVRRDWICTLTRRGCWCRQLTFSTASIPARNWRLAPTPVAHPAASIYGCRIVCSMAVHTATRRSMTPGSLGMR